MKILMNKKINWIIIKKKKKKEEGKKKRHLETNIVRIPGLPCGSVVKNLLANIGDTTGSLIHENPTCHEATKSMNHNYRDCTLDPRSHSY